MILTKPAAAIAVAALCIGGGAVSASAQESCVAYHNRVIAAYQTIGPGSPQYNQMANDYSARCLSGASAAPDPAYYQAPYAYQPAPVDPAAALVGAAIVGGVVAGAIDNDHRGYRDDGYRGYGRRW